MPLFYLKTGAHPPSFTETTLDNLETDKSDIERWENDGGSSHLLTLS